MERIQPQMPPGAYQTYAISQPTATHSRPATCEEVECAAFINGWKTIVPTGSPQEQYIRAKSRRLFVASTPPGGLTEFVFSPGQRCFTQHRVSLERPAFFLKVGGDWRAKTSDPVQMEPEDWVDDFAEHQDKIITLQGRG